MSERLTPAQLHRVRPRPRKPRRKPLRREAVLQEQVIRWLDSHLVEGEVVHIRNESRAKLDCVKGKAAGINKGAPDLLVFLPHGRTVMIELKAPKGPNGEKPGYQSPAQKDFQARAEALGFAYTVCRSVEEARTALEAAGAALLPELKRAAA